MADETGSRNAYEVFLSFSRKDYESVVRFKQLLAEVGIPVWFDEERIEGGEEWRETIPNAIERSKVVILAATQNSVESAVVQREILYARRNNTAVVFVYLDAPKSVTLPKKVDFEFGNDHYLTQDPQADAVAFAILRALAKNHGVSSTVYEDHIARLNARNAETLQQIDLLPDLLDRTGQTRAYQIFVSKGKAKLTGSRPWLFLIHGPKPQLLPDFRRALVRYHLKTVLEEENFDCCAPKREKPIEITRGEVRSRDREALTFALAERFKLPRSASETQIAQFFSNHAQSCHVAVFHVNLAEEDYGAFKKFIRFYHKYWEDFPPVGNAAVLVKLAVSYSQPRRGRSSRIGRHCEALKKSKLFANGGSCALEGLTDVPDDQAFLWSGQAPVRQLLDKLRLSEADADAAIRKIYREHGKEELPMSHLAPALREWLIEQLYKQS
tara:strand:+ start:17295 stop:18614 length:1320 start_codon:yes stop_codon:yes gene_type:complete